MIKYFRNIRKKVVAEGNARRYFLYAIGEIMLVVIGILIALSVNNWNVERLEKKEEKEILLGVKKDLQNTIGEFEFLSRIRGMVVSSTKGILEMANVEKVDHQKLDSLIGMTFFRPTFNNQLGSISLLFSSGKINLIQDDSIKTFLISWPGSIDDMREEEVYASNLFQNHYYPRIAKYMSVDDLINNTFATSFFGAAFSEELDTDFVMESDHEGLLSDKLYLNHLRMRASHMNITSAECETLIRQARTIIDIIDQQLKKS